MMLQTEDLQVNPATQNFSGSFTPSNDAANRGFTS
jgi:hypothetical protein